MTTATGKAWVANLVDDCLVDLFKRAAQAAVDADPGPDADAGTCNMDTPAFRIDGMRESRILAIAERAGVRVTSFKWFGGKRWFWLHVPMNGQGNRRSAMMEAAQRVLRDAAPSAGKSGVHTGFRACGYYQMD